MSANSGRIAVVFFALGGPDGPEAIRPYLKNFFMDKNIIRAPLPVRMIVSSLIAARRSKNEAGTSYGLLGGRSPILENTLEQARAVEAVLATQGGSTEYKTFVCMRYWHPRSDAVAAAVKDWRPDTVVLIPLYPQYSTTTSRSALEDWQTACGRIGLQTPQVTLCCWPFEEGFIAASAALVRRAYEALGAQQTRVLFSAHGLPEKVIADGDPYQWQSEESARRIAAATGLTGLDWQICYQSRVGPLKWIGPSTEEALRRAAADKVPVIVYPHAFVCEHVETLVEIEIEYRHLAQELGVPGFARVPTVAVERAFIDGLAGQVVRLAARPPGSIDSHAGARLCPPQLCRCAHGGP